MGLMPLGEICSEQKVDNSDNCRITTSGSPGLKMLAALIVLSHAVGACKATEMAFNEPMSVDRSLLAWCVFALMALLWTLAWELIK